MPAVKDSSSVSLRLLTLFNILSPSLTAKPRSHLAPAADKITIWKVLANELDELNTIGLQESIKLHPVSRKSWANVTFPRMLQVQTINCPPDMHYKWLACCRWRWTVANVHWQDLDQCSIKHGSVDKKVVRGDRRWQPNWQVSPKNRGNLNVKYS